MSQLAWSVTEMTWSPTVHCHPSLKYKYKEFIATSSSSVNNIVNFSIMIRHIIIDVSNYIHFH